MRYIYLILIVLVAVSCSKDLEDLNKDTKSPNEVPGETLFSNAQKELSDQVASINVNLNIFKLIAQYATETTYTDEANYDVVNRTIPDNAWRILYKDVLRDLKESKEVLEATREELVLDADKAVLDNKIAIIEIHEAYTYNRLVDLFGDIPYEEALDINNILPKYDDAETIYGKLFDKIDAAYAMMDDTYGSFGSADIIYGGDVAMWKKFAMSLKLKMGIHLADYDNATAQSMIEDAVSNGVFTSTSDDAKFTYLGATPNTNPLYVDLVASGRHDFVAANTMVDILKDLNDPRLSLYYTTIDTGAGPEYIGGQYGYNSPYDNHSHLSPVFEEPSFPCTIFSFSEVCFYLAEAAERGYSVSGIAADFYTDGITASIVDDWGGVAGDATTYLAQPDINYATATAATSWQEVIGTQGWIASFNRGFIGWTFWRRLDYPAMNTPENPRTEDGSVPVRFIYPINEQTLNGDNYDAAAAAIGGDKLITKLFWDVN